MDETVVHVQGGMPADLKTSASLLALIEAAKAQLAAMSEDERQAMWAAQRESWVRGMCLPCEHGVLDFEQCEQCRKPAIDDGHLAVHQHHTGRDGTVVTGYGLPDKIWVNEFAYVPEPPPVNDVELPEDVVDLVIAAREFWGDNNDLSPESHALDKALEPFSSRVPYENQPEIDQ